MTLMIAMIVTAITIPPYHNLHIFIVTIIGYHQDHRHPYRNLHLYSSSPPSAIIKIITTLIIIFIYSSSPPSAIIKIIATLIAIFIYSSSPPSLSYHQDHHHLNRNLHLFIVTIGYPQNHRHLHLKKQQLSKSSSPPTLSSKSLPP